MAIAISERELDRYNRSDDKLLSKRRVLQTHDLTCILTRLDKGFAGHFATP
jgi:hypothetical protein